MTITECIEFAKQNPNCTVATVEQNKPHVRTMALWFADNSGFYFQTSTNKDVWKQILENRNIELCFYQHQGIIGSQLRIEGEAEIIDTPELRERILHDRPFLRHFGITKESPELVFFRIAHGKAHMWDMRQAIHNKEYVDF
ncbi:MAG TPA: pyridoxamine 5'-phosphate oxidase family protein [Bacteroidales bacterium]|nr:pyridoxamine 5'-phosphate oxidase family protein [Bacteroidales bacterium]